MSEVALGVDIGGTRTKLAFVERSGRRLAQGTFRTDAHDSADGYVEALVEAVRSARRELGDGHTVRGVGIGAPNANHFRGTVEDAPNLRWKGVVPLARLVSEALGLPTVLTNDANAAALGEMRYGNARGLSDFVLVTLGTGLGSGFVSGGKLLYGHDGLAGELGHVIVEPGGRLCGCGRRGCLERYASVTGLVLTVRELLASGRPSSLGELDADGLGGRAVDAAARAGDELALEAFARTGQRLGLALANAVAITSPEAVVLFGGLVAAGERILEPTRQAFEENLLATWRGRVRLLLSGLDDAEAGVLGAAALSWREHEGG